MRPPSRRFQRDTITLKRRVDVGYSSDGRGVMQPEFESITLPGSYQFAVTGDRRTERRDANDRLSGQHTARVFIRAKDLPGGLEPPIVRTGDIVEFAGREYAVRGEPIEPRRDRSGTIVSYAFDVDYMS